MINRATSQTLFLLGFLLCLSGCRTVPLDQAGTMQATYVAGRFNMIVNADVAETIKAAHKSFGEMQMFLVASERSTFAAELAVRTNTDRKIKLSIREMNSRQSEIGIRVDVAGDQALSRALYERIEANLGR